MKFFEAQKRAAFATKLFATVGFDFEAALKASDESALKTAFDAHSSPAIAALFTSAGLDAAALTAAGPDALKLHIEGLDDSAAAETLTNEITAANGCLDVLGKQLSAANAVFKAIGLAEVTNTTKAEDITKAFEAHVAKQTTLKLGQTGHPAAHVPAITDPVATAAVASDEQLLKEYQGLIEAHNLAIDAEDPAAIRKADAARREFGVKHNAAIQRAHEARRRKA